MNKVKLSSWKTSLFFIFLVFSTSCSEEDASINPILTWLDGEGSVEASEVSLDFKWINYKSSKEVHSYQASIKDKIVSGTFEVFNFDAEGNPVSDAHGDIESISFDKDCMTVRVTGIITSGSDPEYLGKYAVWTALDDNSSVNETTDIRYPVDEATAKYHRDYGLALEWYNLDSFLPTGGKIKLESKDCK